MPDVPAGDAVPLSSPEGGAAADRMVIDPAMTPAQAAAMVTTATAAAYARLAAMQAAHKAWAVPPPSNLAGATNARTAGLKADGVTDDTAALQSLLSSLPSGAMLYFPSGTYRIDGPVSVTRPVTLFGAPGTIWNLTKATTQRVFNLNSGGSSTSRLSSVTITGLTIEGPGIETLPTIVYGRHLDNLEVSHVKFHNIGFAAIEVYATTDMLVEHCVFDNVYYSGQGYGVSLCDGSDRIVVRDSFFVTKGRHGISTGTANPALPPADYGRAVTVENNYFEHTSRAAADTHLETLGPYVVRNNVFYKCQSGVSLRGGYAEITDNIVIGENVGYCGIFMFEEGQVPPDLPCNKEIMKILRNTVLDTSFCGLYLFHSNDLVQDNILSGTGYNGLGVAGAYTPTSIRIERNIIKGWDRPIYIVVPAGGITQLDNYLL